MAANTNYRFKTIMVSDFVREEFTQFRDQLDGVRVTDKELSALAWALGDKEQLLSTMKALKGRITDRTRNFIDRLADAHDYRNGTLGHRGRRSLENDPDFDAILVLAEADQNGRKPGAKVPSVEQAIEIIKALEFEGDIPF